MPAHDADIFQPTVASANALHRPRLQVRCLTAVCLHPAGVLPLTSVAKSGCIYFTVWRATCLRACSMHACPSHPLSTDLQGDALTVIAWDERMELHEEAGASASMHPERPDRVRAVMARLQVRGGRGAAAPDGSCQCKLLFRLSACRCLDCSVCKPCRCQPPFLSSMLTSHATPALLLLQAAELAGRCRRLPAREATAEEIQVCDRPSSCSAWLACWGGSACRVNDWQLKPPACLKMPQDVRHC